MSSKQSDLLDNRTCTESMPVRWNLSRFWPKVRNYDVLVSTVYRSYVDGHLRDDPDQGAPARRLTGIRWSTPRWPRRACPCHAGPGRSPWNRGSSRRCPRAAGAVAGRWHRSRAAPSPGREPAHDPRDAWSARLRPANSGAARELLSQLDDGVGKSSEATRASSALTWVSSWVGTDGPCQNMPNQVV